MKVIPVIDLKGGRVVAARMGNRAEYAPLAGPLCTDSEPDTVVLALLGLYPFDTLYIADLDAIAGSASQLPLIRSIHRAHPQLSLWVDNGLTDLPELSLVARPVIGTESLRDPEQLVDLLRTLTTPLLSLDFRGSALVGPKDLERQPAIWPADVIAMSLSRVGADTGPDFELLTGLRTAAPGKRLYAAGGVRHRADLDGLCSLGVRGALVSTALHDGRIAQHDIRELSII